MNSSFKDLKKFDDSFPDGVFSSPRDSTNYKVKVRALYNYCKEHGTIPNQMTENELKRFLVKDKKDNEKTTNHLD